MKLLAMAGTLAAAFAMAGPENADTAHHVKHKRVKHVHHAKREHVEHALDWLFVEHTPAKKPVKHAHAKHKHARAAHIKKHSNKSS